MFDRSRLKRCNTQVIEQKAETIDGTARQGPRVHIIDGLSKLSLLLASSGFGIIMGASMQNVRSMRMRMHHRLAIVDIPAAQARRTVALPKQHGLLRSQEDSYIDIAWSSIFTIYDGCHGKLGELACSYFHKLE